MIFSFLTSLIAQTRNFDSTKKEVVNGIPTIKGFEALFENIISIVLGIGAIALFVMLLTGGFQFLTSGGDPKAAETAKKTISTAILGIFILVVSYLFLVFIQQFTGFEVTIFKVFQP